PYDARELGRYVHQLAAPPTVHTFMGVVPQLGRDVLHFMRANRLWKSAWHVFKVMAGHARDVALYRRGNRLTNGRALAARLLKSALDLGVELRSSSPVVSLIVEGGAVKGGVLDTPEGKVTVRARRGVVLCCGGFSFDEALRRKYFPQSLNAHAYWPATARGADGSGVRLARAAGAAIKDDLSTPT